MPQYNTDPQREVNPYEALWQPLVRAADVGVQLSLADERMLQTREAVFRIADYYAAVGAGDLDDDPVAHNEALVSCYQGFDTLRRLGLQPYAQAGRPSEDYDTPNVMAEYVAGQWLGLTSRPAFHLTQIQQEIDTKHPTTFITDWAVMHGMKELTDYFLALSLGRPQLPPVERNNRQVDVS